MSFRPARHCHYGLSHSSYSQRSLMDSFHAQPRDSGTILVVYHPEYLDPSWTFQAHQQVHLHPLCPFCGEAPHGKIPFAKPASPSPPSRPRKRERYNLGQVLRTGRQHDEAIKAQGHSRALRQASLHRINKAAVQETIHR